MPSRLLKAALIGLGLSTAGNAVVLADDGRRVALIIGNGAYENASALANPTNDARDVAAALTELGFEVHEGYDLDRPAMSQTIRDFSQALDGAEVGLFFYAGHGLQVNGKNYMAPVDAAFQGAESLDFEAIDMGLVLAQMERAPRTNLIILDACRDNPFAQSLARAMGATRSLSIGQGLAQLETVAVGTLIAYSTQPGATAADGTGRNSPFTGAMLEEIRTPGLEVQQMMRRVRAKVIEVSAGAQVPWDNSSLTTDFYFVEPPVGQDAAPIIAPTEPSERQIEVRFWFDVKDSGSTAELQSYLDKYPDGEFAGAATARINGLTLAAAAPGGDPGSVEALYAKLAARDIIIPEPRSAHEYYNNARYYELRSDALNAGKMYAQFIAFGLPKVDPHYAYQDYLKAQEGRAGAREAYNELVYDHPGDDVLKFAAALLQPPEQRKALLEEYVASHPDFAPAFYELANEYSARRLGAQTIADRRNEHDFLTRFVSASESGDLYTYFMDQRLAQDQLEDAEQRLVALSSFAQPSFDQPIDMTFHTGTGNLDWTVTFTAKEMVKEYYVAWPGEDFRGLGNMDLGSYSGMVSQPMVQSSITVPRHGEPLTLQVQYRDQRDEIQGPWDFMFHPTEEAVKFAKATVYAPEWRDKWAHLIAIGDGTQSALGFSLLASLVPDELSDIRYGLEIDMPDTSFPIQRWAGGADPTQDATDPIESHVLTPHARYVSVQLHFIDGTHTEVVQVDEFVD